LVEPQFPTVKIGARRSNTLAATPLIASFTQRLVKALCGEYLAMNRVRKRTGLPTRTLTSHVRKGGIACQARASGRRSSHSSPMLRVTPETRRRGTGRGSLTREGAGREMRQSCSMLKGIATFTGEPCARKPARTVCAVRRFEVSLSQTGGTREVFLSYQLTRRRKPNGTTACWGSGACLKAL
jgi:hypothetical protein